VPVENVVVAADGTAVSYPSAAQMGLCGTQPCTTYPVYSHQLWIIDEETFPFKIKSFYPGV
jgi:hypothetical protein